MYSQIEASQLKQAFWTTFGQYIAPRPGANGLKVNWINYKTGLKHIYFRMYADNAAATIGIELTHPDIEIQELFFDEFILLKGILEASTGETWQWELHNPDKDGKIISRIFMTLPGISIFNKNDWPALISFFTPRIVALDVFWNDVSDRFDALK